MEPASSGADAPAAEPVDEAAAAAKLADEAASAVLETPGSALSASAPAFVPGAAAVAGGSDSVEANTGDATESTELAWLPARHQALLRRWYACSTGEWAPYYVGTLKSFNIRTGYGFIDCAAAREAFGRDVFIHKSCVPNPWHIGQPVEFAVVCNSCWQPQAADVSWLPQLPGAARVPPKPVAAAAGKGAFDVALPTLGDGASTAASASSSAATPTPTPAADAADAAGSAQAAAQIEPKRLGTLKSYSAAQGYGFIGCEEVFAECQRDVFFKKSQLPPGGWVDGQIVEFSVVKNARGQPQAHQIEWDPVPRVAAQGARPESQRTHTAETLAHLRKLMGQLSDHPEMAIIQAIGLQGESHASGASEAEASRDVDFVSFVLDRLGAPAAAAASISDFVKMLLLLMVAKMLRRLSRSERCSQLVAWFAALAETIQPGADRVKGHFPEVIGQIDKHLQHVWEGSPGLTDQARLLPLNAAFKQLKAKAAELAEAGSA